MSESLWILICFRSGGLSCPIPAMSENLKRLRWPGVSPPQAIQGSHFCISDLPVAAQCQGRLDSSLGKASKHVLDQHGLHGRCQQASVCCVTVGCTSPSAYTPCPKHADRGQLVLEKGDVLQMRASRGLERSAKHSQRCLSPTRQEMKCMDTAGRKPKYVAQGLVQLRSAH